MPEDYDPQRNAEEAADTDPSAKDTTDPKHDPYWQLRPFQFKKGQSGNLAGRPPEIRSLAKRLRAAGSIRAAELAPFRQVAEKLGLPRDVIDQMDLFDVYLCSMMLHGVRGKPAAIEQITKLFGKQLPYKPSTAPAGASQSEVDKQRAIAFYEAIIEGEDVELADKLKARERLDRLQGLVQDETGLDAEEMAQALRDAMTNMDESVPEPVEVPEPAPDAAG